MGGGLPRGAAGRVAQEQGGARQAVQPRQPHLQHVVQQRHTALLGLGLCELQQRAHLKAVGVPSVAALRGTAVSLPDSWGWGQGGWGAATYIVEEVPNSQD